MTTPDSYPLNEPVNVTLAVNTGGALVQSAWAGATFAGGSGTVTVTLGSSNPSGPNPGPTAPGNCLIAYVGTDQGTTNPVVSGITLGGAAGNWGAARQQNNNADLNCEVWVDWNCAGGQTTVAVTVAGGSGAGGFVIVRVEERSGILTTSNPVDQVNGANGSSTAISSGNTPTLSQANELVVGAISAGSSASLAGPGAPWTNQNVITQGAGISLVCGAQVVSSTAGIAYTGTETAGVWGAVVVSLRLVTQSLPAGSGIARITPGYPGAPGSGVGASRNSGLLWNVAGVAVSVATKVNEAQASCYISHGIQSATPNDFQGQTQLGSTGDTCTVSATLKPGDWITVIWTGGDPGAIATMRVFGTVTPPGVR